MKTLKTTLILIGIVISFALLGFAGRAWGLWNFQFFAPKYENARREVFENSQSYIEGKRQELTKHYDEWTKADDQGKQAIRFVVMSKFSNFNMEHLSYSHRVMYDRIIANEK